MGAFFGCLVIAFVLALAYDDASVFLDRIANALERRNKKDNVAK